MLLELEEEERVASVLDQEWEEVPEEEVLLGEVVEKGVAEQAEALPEVWQGSW